MDTSLRFTVGNVFLRYIHENPCYLNYDPYISEEEFDAHLLTRFLTPKQRSKINLFATTANVDKINRFVILLQSKGGVLRLPELNAYEQLPRLALLAYLKRRDISKAQVASISLLYQGVKQLLVKPVCCLIYDRQDSVHKRHIEIVKLPPVDERVKITSVNVFEKSEWLKTFFALTNAQLKKLLLLLEKKPNSEHYFHAIAVPLGETFLWSPGLARIANLLKILQPVEIEEVGDFPGVKKKVMIIPSFSMLQAYIEIIYGDDAMPVTPLFGECTKEILMALKLSNKRPFHLGSEEAPTPDKADGYYFGALAYTLHDFYHLCRDSEIGQAAMRAIRYIVEYLFRTPLNQNTEELKWELMDVDLYLKRHRFGKLFDLAGWNWGIHKNAIVHDIALQKAFWESEFNVTREDLQAPEQTMYDLYSAIQTPEQRQRAYVERFRHYAKTARGDDPFAHTRLGLMYSHGIGTLINHEKALVHWKLAGNHDPALYEIGRSYLFGKGVPISLKHAYHYFNRASRTIVDAQFQMGCGHYLGIEGVLSQNYTRAFFYFTLAAGEKHYLALHHLAMMYMNGQGTAKNLQKAVDACTRAAKAGVALSQNLMGVWYFSGLTGLIKKDIRQAIFYFSLAAKQNCTPAKQNLKIALKSKEKRIGKRKSMTSFTHGMPVYKLPPKRLKNAAKS